MIIASDAPLAKAKPVSRQSSSVNRKSVKKSKSIITQNQNLVPRGTGAQMQQIKSIYVAQDSHLRGPALVDYSASRQNTQFESSNLNGVEFHQNKSINLNGLGDTHTQSTTKIENQARIPSGISRQERHVNESQNSLTAKTNVILPSLGKAKASSGSNVIGVPTSIRSKQKKQDYAKPVL